jgi:putative ABC transport system permease protein
MIRRLVVFRTLWQHEIRRSVGLLLRRRKFASLISLLTASAAVYLTGILMAVCWGDVLAMPPYPRVNQIAAISARNDALGRRHEPLAWPDIEDINRESRSLASVAGYQVSYANASDLSESAAIKVAAYRGDLFDVLQSRVLAGRVPSASEVENGESVAIVSYRLWQQTLGGDRAAIGKALRLSGRNYQVIGIMPPWFYWPDRSTDLWRPAARTVDRRGFRPWRTVARLRNESSFGELSGEIAALWKRLAKDFPENENWTLDVEGLIESVNAGGKLIVPSMLFSLASALATLAVCALSLGTLSGLARRAECRVRVAVGATVVLLLPTLVTHVLTYVVAVYGLAVLLAVLPGFRSAVHLIELSSTQLLLSLAASAACFGVLYGIAFAVTILSGNRVWMSHRLSPRRVVRFESWEAASALQLAISVPILVVGLTVTTYIASVVDRGLGFDAKRLIVVSLSAQGAGYAYGEPLLTFFERLSARIQSIRGVTSVATATSTPFNELGVRLDLAYRTSDQQITRSSGERRVVVRVVADNYFDAMRMRFVEGYGLSGARDVVRPAVINQTFRHRAIQPGSPIGRRVEINLGGGWQEYTIVGVVQDVMTSVTDGSAEEAYLPHRLFPVFWPMNVIVRTNVEPGTIMETIRKEVIANDRLTPPHRVETMQRLIEESVPGLFATDRILHVAALGVILLMFPIVYISTGANLAPKQRELWIRSSLGATSFRLWSFVAYRAARWIFCGLVGGVVLAILIQRTALQVVPRGGNSVVLVAMTTVSLFGVVCGAHILAAARRFGSLIADSRSSARNDDERS